MIYTITVNPSIDQHITIKKLVKDDAIRATSMYRDPGGKGINVSRVVKELGGKTKAFGIVGGCAGYMLRDLLDRGKVDFEYIEIIGETRINVIITDLSDNTQTRISMAGPDMCKRTHNDFIKLLDRVNPRPSYWVLGGSLLQNSPRDTYKKIIEHLKKNEKCVLDADGEALESGIKASPFLIKPNEYELERLLGKKIKDEKTIAKEAMILCAHHGIQVIIVSLGSRGAILVTKDYAFTLIPPRVEVRSKVGAGDSVIGGFLVSLERKSSLLDAARYGVAAGTAAVITAGTKLCVRKDVDRIFKMVKIKQIKG